MTGNFEFSASGDAKTLSSEKLTSNQAILDIQWRLSKADTIGEKMVVILIEVSAL